MSQDLEKLIEEARKRGPMTDEERREQAASFAFGNLALTKEYANASEAKLVQLRSTCRRMAGCSSKRCSACEGKGYHVSYEDGGSYNSLERVTLDCEECLGHGRLW